MYKRILVPLDGSSLAEGILPHVCGLAAQLDAEIVLLRVVPLGFPNSQPGDVSGRRPKEVSEAEQYLRAVAEHLPRGVKARTLVEAMETGFFAERILECAALEDAAIIAMSTHGRSGLSRLISGSVAEKVIRRSERPVLLIRAKGGEA